MRAYINQMYQAIRGPLPKLTKPKPAPPPPPSPLRNLKKMNNPTLGELPIYAQHLKTVKVPGVSPPKLQFKQYLSDLDQPAPSSHQ